MRQQEFEKLLREIKMELDLVALGANPDFVILDRKAAEDFSQRIKEALRRD